MNFEQLSCAVIKVKTLSIIRKECSTSAKVAFTTPQLAFWQWELLPNSYDFLSSVQTDVRARTSPAESYSFLFPLYIVKTFINH